MEKSLQNKHKAKFVRCTNLHQKYDYPELGHLRKRDAHAQQGDAHPHTVRPQKLMPLTARGWLFRK